MNELGARGETTADERIAAARSLVKSLDPRLVAASAVMRGARRGPWQDFIKRIRDKEEDIAALWVAYPRAVAQQVDVDFDIALYYDDGVANDAGRFMSTFGLVNYDTLGLVGIYDVLLGVDKAYVGILSLAFSAGKAGSAFVADSTGADVYMAGLRRVVELVERYGNDPYCMSMLAAFSKTAAKTNPRRSLDEVLADYNRVERTVATMARETVRAL